LALQTVVPDHGAGQGQSDGLAGQKSRGIFDRAIVQEGVAAYFTIRVEQTQNKVPHLALFPHLGLETLGRFVWRQIAQFIEELSGPAMSIGTHSCGRDLRELSRRASAQGLEQPGPGHAPVAADGDLGNAQRLSNLRIVESSKVA
jgi:hypothetical protein